MSELKIQIPVRTSDNFGDPINFVLESIEKINSSDSKTLNFDFDNCKFTSPFLIGGLTALAHAHAERGGENTWVYNKNNEYLSGYMDAISFPEGYDYSENSAEELNALFQPYHNKTYIPIICFPTGLNKDDVKIRESILTAVNTIFKNQLNLKGDMLHAVYYLVDELTQNIVDHSKSSKGIIFAQFYPSKNYMDVCIADYGKGLLKIYQDSDKHNPKNTEEAMKYAIRGESTKDIPESRGFGISTSREMLVKGLKGKFFLMSDNTFYVQSADKQEVIVMPDSYRYKGCYVAMRIPILQNEQFSFYNYIE